MLTALWIYIYRVFIAIDRTVNTVLLGDLDQTISYRAATAWAEERKWGCYLCRILDFIHREHCRNVMRTYGGAPLAELLLPHYCPHWSDFSGLAPLVPYLPVILSHYW
ncbi:hypothetical protein [Phyllobacterium myrsinacearum]|uniref:Uncharacterized protein n=1 Tax=Phyllobacterium myrsinacearum TaxID=28101 RepID=A0A839EMC2_9HYPH|nr:hypothetical protein [Phyllobacterium myrsinacearum]MBA8881713.1 hypothetical protein [Phyllobacterium myrsinacearum]